MPEKAGELWAALGRTGRPESAEWKALELPPVAGDRTVKPPILFPKSEGGQ
jgi:hypothetical protein